jgi:hypothetical protein
VLDLHRLFEQTVEEEAALAPWWVPSSQRLRSEETRCARGMTTWAGSPLAAMLVRSWTKPAAASPASSLKAILRERDELDRAGARFLRGLCAIWPVV